MSFEKPSASSPTMPRPTSTWGNVLRELGSHLEAVDHYRCALRFRPGLCQGPLQPRPCSP